MADIAAKKRSFIVTLSEDFDYSQRVLANILGACLGLLSNKKRLALLLRDEKESKSTLKNDAILLSPLAFQHSSRKLLLADIRTGNAYT